MFGSDGKSDRALINVLLRQFPLGQLGMRGGGGMNDQRFHVRDVCKQREDFKCVDERVRFLLPALDVKGEDRKVLLNFFAFCL